ncbi:MAG: O-antigen ligase family protein [Proteobacteria bacterium]|nr:O-antigen ligase family protein [Pseudomonadota bacterium]
MTILSLFDSSKYRIIVTFALIVICFSLPLFIFSAFRFLLILILVTIVFTVCIVLRSIKPIFYAFLFGMFVFNRDFAHLSIHIGSITLYVTEAVLALFILKNMLLVPFKKIIKEVKTPLDIPFAIYYLIGFILLIKNLPIYGMIAVRHFVLVYYALFFYIITDNIRSFEDIQKIVKLCFIGGIISAILLLGRMIPQTNHLIELISPKSNTIGRSVSISLSVIFFISLNNYITNNKVKIVLFFSTLIQILAIIMGMSRSAWVALAGSLIFLFIISTENRKYMLSVGIPVLIGVIALIWGYNHFVNSSFFSNLYTEVSSIYTFDDIKTGSTANSKWRLESYKTGFQEILQHPLGKGFGPPAPDIVVGAGQAKGEIDSLIDYHNSPLSILIRTGFLGFAAFLCVNAIFYYRTIQFCMKTNKPLHRAYMIGILAGHLSIFINSLFFMVLQVPYMGVFYWIFMGLGIALIKISNELKSSEQLLQESH